MRPVVNVYDAELQRDEGDPPGFDTAYLRTGNLLGGEKIGMSVFELGAGQAICPYHYEVTEEEWLVCLAGAPTLRTPEGERMLEPGDTVCFPSGPAGGHKVTAGEQPARVAIFSTKAAVGVTVYPDSRKLGVWHHGEHHMVRIEPHLDYYDGEA
jgi:uncharacterized cupin superfamily protein